MRWRERRGSDNIADRRAGAPVGARRAGGLGLVGVIVVLAAGLLFGVDLTPLLSGPWPAPQAARTGPNVIDDAAEEFVAVVLADTEAVWTAAFAAVGAACRAPTLVLFSGAVGSACGQASSAVGPVYCPRDGQAYLDLDFFATPERELGARVEFARACVVAHEVAHHVRHLIGVMEQTMALRARAPAAEANAVPVRMEACDTFSGAT